MKKIIISVLLVTPAFVWGGSPATTFSTVVDELLINRESVDKKIVVTGFSRTDGIDSRDGDTIAERINTELVKSNKIKVVERKEIEKILRKLKLQRSEAITPDSAKEIGKILSADWVVVGTLTRLSTKQLEVNIKMVGVESGEILSSATCHVNRDWVGQYRKLLIDENRKIKRNPKDARSFYERGVIYSDLGEDDNAIASFSRAIRIDPRFVKAYFNRAGKYIDAKAAYQKAIADYSKALEIDPNYADAYCARGIAYHQEFMTDEGIGDDVECGRLSK